MRLLLILLVLLINCNTGPNSTSFSLEDLEIEDLQVYIQDNYPDLALVTSPFNRDIDVYPPNFSQGVDTGYDFLFAYDFNDDGYLDYIFRLFEQTDLEDNNRFDSVVEVYTELIFGGKADFERVDDGFGYSGFVFNGTFNSDSYSASSTYGILPSGEYSDFNDSSFVLTKPSLASLMPSSYGVTEWFNANSSVFYLFWSD